MPLDANGEARIEVPTNDALTAFLRETKPQFLINAAGYTGKPNVDACETARADTLAGIEQAVQKLAGGSRHRDQG